MNKVVTNKFSQSLLLFFVVDFLQIYGLRILITEIYFIKEKTYLANTRVTDDNLNLNDISEPPSLKNIYITVTFLTIILTFHPLEETFTRYQKLEKKNSGKNFFVFITLTITI